MKMIKSVLIVITLQLIALYGQETVSWHIDLRTPDSTPEDARVYIAGNFNGWDPGNSDYRLFKDEKGMWTGDFVVPRGKVEYKYTLGGWAQVEISIDGADIDNRTKVLTEKQMKSYDEVAAWRTDDKTPNIVGQVNVIEKFDIPQLNRTRRIWIYLPPDYGKGLKRFPVLYMHDGQNLFADSTSFSGEWGIDETLEALYLEKSVPQMIVVGIDNSEHRLSEYSPFDFEYKGIHKGEAQQYGKFIVETLKPYIDKHYRTKKGRRHTAISGSSMGGLVSVYIAIEHQQVFSKVGALSSAFGVCRDSLLLFINNTPKKYPVRFWFDLGSLEDEEMQYDVNQRPVVDALIKAGWKAEKEVKFIMYDGAGHHERYWRARFGDVLKYLWGK